MELEVLEGKKGGKAPGGRDMQGAYEVWSLDGAGPKVPWMVGARQGGGGFFRAGLGGYLVQLDGRLVPHV